MTISSFFVPNRQLVDEISNSNPAVVTTTEAHGYQTGLKVRFFFPFNVGMNQLKDKVMEITVLTEDSFSIPIDSSNFDVFSPSSSTQSPQIIPVGEIADILSESVKNNRNIVPEY